MVLVTHLDNKEINFHLERIDKLFVEGSVLDNILINL